MIRPWPITLNIDLGNKDVPMYQALAEELQRLIESGLLQPGEALPSSRGLAQQLGISRKTVVTAMESLVYGGWVERRNRVGLFVSNRFTPHSDEAVVEAASAHAASPDVSPMLVIDEGLPDISLVPSAELGRAYRQFLGCALRWTHHPEADPKGVPHLRQVIATAMCHSYGLCVDHSELLISSGINQAIYLVAHALLHPGDVVAVESMILPVLAKAYESAGIELVRIAVDAEGLQVNALAELLEQNGRVRAVHVTPRVNYPTTASLSAQRRQQLVGLVKAHNLLLVEDDFDGFFQLSGTALPTLASMLPKENYVYANTAKRVLSPIVRIGFVASSAENIERMVAYKRCMEGVGDVVLERAVLDMIEAGVMRRHIRRSIKVYIERLDYITQRIKKQLRGKVIYHRPKAGLAIWLEMLEDPEPKLTSRGIKAPIFTLPNGCYGLRIGYASMTKDEIDMLVEALG